MNWYYAANGEQHGPVTEETLHDYIGEGRISRETLVWREGMDNWQSYATSFPGALSASGSPPPLAQVPQHNPVMTAHANAPGSGYADAESIRREHIGHEASIKSVSILYFLSAALLLLSGTFIALGSAQPDEAEVEPVVGGIMALFGLLQVVVGIGLRKLKSWARAGAICLSGIGLLAFPLGTLINGYILYLLLAAKGRMVFSEHYLEIIQLTPEIRHKTSMIVWILLILVVALIVIPVVYIAVTTP